MEGREHAVLGLPIDLRVLWLGIADCVVPEDLALSVTDDLLMIESICATRCRVRIRNGAPAWRSEWKRLGTTAHGGERFDRDRSHRRPRGGGLHCVMLTLPPPSISRPTGVLMRPCPPP